MNAKLTGNLLSETFVNDAVKGSASYPANGSAGTSSAGRTTLKFAYDATTKTYTVVDGSVSRAFSAADIDATLSSGTATVYKIVNGSITDSLYLTKPSLGGARSFQYVGGGFWQRTTTSPSSISATLDAFTYGAQTAASDVPRIGNATYDIFLKGVISFADQPVALEGDGTLLIKFADGNFTFAGTADRTLINTGQANGQTGYSGQGILSGSANSFSGTIDTTLGGANNGALNGRFYGPGAAELGMVWTDSVVGATAAGTILGKKQAAPANLLTTPAAYNVTLSSQNLYYPVDGANQQLGSVATGNYGIVNFSIGGPSAAYAYQVSGAPYVPSQHTATFQNTDLVAAESNSTWQVYRNQANGGPSELRMFTTSSSNSQIVLSYASFGIWSDRITDAGSTYRSDRFFIFGNPTDPSFRPSSGTATYNGKMLGYAYGSEAGQYVRRNADGTFNLTFNFNSDTMSGTLNGGIVGGDGVRRDFASLPMSGNLHPTATTFTGQLGGGGFGGAFFGPGMDEIVATFQTGVADPAGGPSGYSMIGALAGKKN